MFHYDQEKLTRVLDIISLILLIRVIPNLYIIMGFSLTLRGKWNLWKVFPIRHPIAIWRNKEDNYFITININRGR